MYSVDRLCVSDNWRCLRKEHDYNSAVKYAKFFAKAGHTVRLRNEANGDCTYYDENGKVKENIDD